ncbi:hypothetical protein [Rummeliibacillus stabekisii]|uniref:hypothetical protein n=1 Tax=Rummeliibacillus stabekisii TaxID=241244 RepID=UPI0011BE00D0|nr:hypothetical protein [Rummeliibacillus stabekisii]MBB5168977.1 hypothetical protein [Rummeliibacillus stabekisii]
MSIKIKRDTGVMGGATPVALKVNSQLVKKLKNNEEYSISSDEGKVKVKANQWFFGSEEKQIESGSRVNIKINNTALLLYVISLIIVFAGGFTSIIPLSLIGLIGIVITVIYSTKRWFKLEIESIAN